ncbi:MAG: hypothetical protein A2W90_21905 [Bacteroidetes bacterium GWF2_42_66]|nr:MAG: hypothetical protein A2W92_04720 [Bacteroidetes bacterium GWA2_42_15]OFY03255.1 MAG: hypothetical protein A2W89_18955 [Bacteroidetes bacterium GWE2_42_39]OFY45695.1 MAG: hypothetical protein A2W90_21905 [Bacteroidetes bacterium GWF2_42_66]HBL77316.1 ATP-binding protein [Prolixibacteraceae bacterium]HCR91941.1 ATP-binding protein [Prolixibacteraceae bacterium]
MNPNKTLLAIVLFLIAGNISIGQQLVKVWETEAVFQIPESVLYNPDSGDIFVSNIQGPSAEKDGEGFISILGTDGKVKNLKWVAGLNAPKGMAVFDGKLYVSDVDALVEIDIKKATITKRHPVKDAIFLNDVAVSESGMVFVSDSKTGKIYVLDKNEISEVLREPISGTNGLFAADDKLYIGSGKIHAMDLKTRELKILYEDAGGVDGIELMDDGNFLFSHWAGRIFITQGDKTIKLLDTSEAGINSADIDYAKEIGLVLVPTFRDNRVVAYKLTGKNTAPAR